MKEVLLVSKPLAPPWSDSGKVYVRTLVDHLPERRFRVLVPRGAPYPAPNAVSEEIYRDPGRYQPSLAQNARVFGRLLWPDRKVALYHFFFAPNPRTSRAARLACRVSGKRSIQTVLSAPERLEDASGLFFADRVVVLSDHTRERVARATETHAVRVYPGVTVGEPLSLERRERAIAALGVGDAPLVLYPGDLEFSSAAQTVIDAAPAILRAVPSARVVLACRPKTSRAAVVERDLRERVRGEGRVLFAGEVPDMRALVAASSVAVLPAESTYAKTDLPLVLLEALAEGVPIVVGDVPPLSEILQDEVGVAVPPGSPEALAGAAIRLLRDAARRAELSARARSLARARFSAEAMAREYERLYRELAGC
jgi:glycosyltransferase involved in cell wall biosynthesis